MNQMTLPLSETNYIDNTPPVNKWDARFREFHKQILKCTKSSKTTFNAMNAGLEHYDAVDLIMSVGIPTRNKGSKSITYHAYYARLFTK